MHTEGGKNNIKLKKINKYEILFKWLYDFQRHKFYIIFTELRNVLNIIDFCNRFDNNIENVFIFYFFLFTYKKIFSFQ